MFASLKSPSIRQIWTAWAFRSLLLIGALFVAGYFGLLNSELALLCGTWLLLSLLTSLAMTYGWHAAIFFRLSGFADLAFGLFLIAHSGGAQSPLWWTLILTYVSPGLDPFPLQTALTYTLILMPSSILLAWLEKNLIDGLRFSAQDTHPLAERVRRAERSRANELVRMAVEINSSLNVDEVLDLALDLSTRAVISGDGQEHTLRSALLLLTDDGFEVVASRHLRPDRAIQIKILTSNNYLDSGSAAMSSSPH
jgi:hypothetical protein